jgi:phosphopantothenoylcysteine decarboxylase/phosphopantothenate--cysteine ligase
LAVADWRTEAAPAKLKKRDGALPNLAFVENPDILAGVAAPGPRRPRLVVGFAAETGSTVEEGQVKLARKGCDWIVANDVSGDVMGSDANRVHLITAGGVEDWPAMAKREVAGRLVDRIAAAIA